MNFFNKVLNNTTHNPSKSPFTMGQPPAFQHVGVKIWIIKKGKNHKDSYPFNNSSYYTRTSLFVHVTLQS